MQNGLDHTAIICSSVLECLDAFPAKRKNVRSSDVINIQKKNEKSLQTSLAAEVCKHSCSAFDPEIIAVH